MSEISKDESTGGLHRVLGGVYHWMRGDQNSSKRDDFENKTTWRDPWEIDELNDLDDVNDGEIGDTISLIKRTENRWINEDDTRDLLNVDYMPKSYESVNNDDIDEELDQLIRRLENNNETLLKMLENFDSATFKADYKNVKVENQKLSKKYYRLRKEYKREIEETRKIHQRYCELVKKYKGITKEQSSNEDIQRNLKRKDSRIAELEKQETQSAKQVSQLQEAHDKFIKERVKNGRENQDSVLHYKNQYEEMHLSYLAKSKEEKALRARIEELEEELDKASKSQQRNSVPVIPLRSTQISEDTRYSSGMPRLDADTMNTMELLRRKFADKTYEGENITVNTHISRPRIEL
ncbi:hypothetical protein FOA43_002598 [Brettanomyces nanus]|uniref:Uncharacterized protein n=1 Tax=Eeniella nana TaxID=13502 RepID=A0A875S2R8_EENNA|nr:uncharacterized protein FOA43_002598 [Brettanomyces nanus]QPG75248.1 hypothetical protein FOA43_002598 [Brettanomyces nanus]